MSTTCGLCPRGTTTIHNRPGTGFIGPLFRLTWSALYHMYHTISLYHTAEPWLPDRPVLFGEIIPTPIYVKSARWYPTCTFIWRPLILALKYVLEWKALGRVRRSAYRYCGRQRQREKERDREVRLLQYTQSDIVRNGNGQRKDGTEPN